jgi:hypothetical protein
VEKANDVLLAAIVKASPPLFVRTSEQPVNPETVPPTEKAEVPPPLQEISAAENMTQNQLIHNERTERGWEITI